MKRLLFALAITTTIAAPMMVEAQTLTLRRVVLSQGGVGYFEYEAEVSGNAELPLTVRLDQMDDVLRTIVVLDDRGGVGGVRTQGLEPLQQAFRDLTFPREALESPAALLAALQGAEITVGGPTPITGRVVSVVEESATERERTTTRHRVTVMGADGMQSFILQDASGVRFNDPALQAEVARALRAVSENRARGNRTLTVLSRGEGQRRVRVGFVAEVPLWKTSYRLIVSPDSAITRGRLQGWAVIENLSGQDWRNIELTLVSGNPVTFRQSLFRPFFVQRQEIPIEVYGRTLPRLDEGGVMAQSQTMERDQNLPGRGRATFAPPAQAAPAPPPIGGIVASRDSRAPEQAARPDVPVEAQDSATQITFRFPQPVTVTAGETLVAPIIDREVPAQSIAVYQQAVNARNPYAAVRLVNDGESGLPPGAIALYERPEPGVLTYAGDARIGPIAPGQSRFLSFALDTRTTVDRQVAQAQTIARGSVADGLLRLTRVDRQTTTYRVTAPPREAREVLIEHPRAPGWTLVAPANARPEETPSALRFSVRAAAGQTETLVVTYERPRDEVLRIVDMGLPQFLAFAGSSELTPPIRAAFAELARLRREAEARRTEIQPLQTERQRVVEDQARTRANLQVVPAGSPQQRQYLEQLAAQERRMGELATAITNAESVAARAQAALVEAIGRLQI